MKDIATGPLTRHGGLKVVEAPFRFTKYQEDFNMEKRYYLAYGSNLNVRQMMMRCPSARIIGTATIKDYKLMFKGSQTGSYLTIEPAPGSEVPVGVWAVSAADERALDRYEGYPNFYYKKDFSLQVIGIRSGKVRPIDAFAYIMHEERMLGKPTDLYLHTCAQGYINFDFNLDILFEALRFSMEGE